MIINDFNEIIECYNNGINKNNIENLEINDSKIYSLLLDYCLDNFEDQKLFKFVKDIYEFHVAKLNDLKIKNAYLNYINAFIGKKKEKHDISFEAKIADDYYYGNFLTQNYEKAYKWYLNATKKNDKYAYLMIGNCYLNGFGVEMNNEEAFKYYTLSAKFNYYFAYNNLGYCYQNGLGVLQDYKMAIYWYQKATRDGSYVAEFNLGRLYEDGLGVKTDLYYAIKCFISSAKKGYKKANEKLSFYGFSSNDIFKIKDYEIDNNKYFVLDEIISTAENVLLPTSFTHIGYEYEIVKEGMMIGDYHHFKTEYIPCEYNTIEKELIVSHNVKKIIIPITVSKISNKAFDKLKNVIIEVHPLNQYYEIIDNSLVEKETKRIIYKF